MTIVNFTPLASFSGGALIGISAVLLFAFSGRIAGITGIVRRALLPGATSRPREAAAFLSGLIAAPFIWQILTRTPVQQTVSGNVIFLAIAGLLAGFGSALANGCTSGHGVCGLSRLSLRSIAATATFMSVAIGTVFVTRHVIGG